MLSCVGRPHQLIELVGSIEEWNREVNNKDTWTYIWASGILTSRKAYECMIRHTQAQHHFSGYGNLVVKKAQGILLVVITK
jgi:hypothetical protein